MNFIKNYIRSYRDDTDLTDFAMVGNNNSTRDEKSQISPATILRDLHPIKKVFTKIGDFLRTFYITTIISFVNRAIICAS